MPFSYVIDERRLIFMRKLLYRDNVVLRMLASLLCTTNTSVFVHSMISKIRCPRECISESVWNAFCNRVF